MKVVVDGDAGVVSVENADNLNALSVVLRDATRAQAASLLGRLGRLDGDHVWFDIKALRSIAPAPRSCSWDARFARTLTGRTDESRSYVRADIERTEETDPR